MLQVVRSSSPVESIAVYATTGMLVREVHQTSVLAVNGLEPGVYIIQAVDCDGSMLSKKILIN
jgi:hypothetical protein